MTLPTREDALVAVEIWNLIAKGYVDQPLLAHIGYEMPALELVRARANGDLLTREEWEDIHDCVLRCPEELDGARCCIVAGHKGIHEDKSHRGWVGEETP